MRVYCLQIEIDWEQKSLNHERVRRLLEAVKPAPGSLVVLPEMFATGFSMNVDAADDSKTQETQRFLAETAARHGAFMMGGVVVADSTGRGRNQCVVYDPEGREFARYSKIRPFTLGGEADHYDAGERVVRFDWGGFHVSPFICYDLRFPELFRAAAAGGANLLTVIANWPQSRVGHWEALLKARAIENQAYVIGVNRSGTDPQLIYPGRSMIIAPGGEVIAEAGAEQCVISADLDREELDRYRRELPFLADLHRGFLRT